MRRKIQELQKSDLDFMINEASAMLSANERLLDMAAKFMPVSSSEYLSICTSRRYSQKMLEKLKDLAAHSA